MVGNNFNVQQKVKENLVRLIYCEMLGLDASFGHIEAMNATQSSKLLTKRVGYLAVSLCLDENHPLAMMTTNSIRKVTTCFVVLFYYYQGLESANYLEVCAALTAMTRLLSDKTVPAFSTLITQLLLHQQFALLLPYFFNYHKPSSTPKSSDGCLPHVEER